MFFLDFYLYRTNQELALAAPVRLLVRSRFINIYPAFSRQ